MNAELPYFDAIPEETLAEIISFLRKVNYLYLVSKRFAANFYYAVKSNGKNMTDENLRRCGLIRSLVLDVTNKATASVLKTLTNLTVLQISNYTLEPGALSHCGELDRLFINSSRVGDDNLICCRNISALSMAFVPDITDAGISQLTRLTRLVVRGRSAFSNSGLKNLDGLTFLHLAHVDTVTNDVFQYLTNLRTLFLTGTRGITGGLAQCKQLRTLILSDSGQFGAFDDAVFKELNLEHLVLKTDRVSNLGLSYCTNLKTLDLRSNCVITNKGLRGLNLRKLNLSFNAKITNSGIIKMTNLESLILEHNQVITDFAIVRLERLTRLCVYKSAVTSSAYAGRPIAICNKPVHHGMFGR